MEAYLERARKVRENQCLRSRKTLQPPQPLIPLQPPKAPRYPPPRRDFLSTVT
jgi:hypothetical protein